MAKYALSALLGATLGVALLAPALAQEAASTKKTAKAGGDKIAAAPAKEGKSAQKPASPGENAVVGSVNGKPITWGQLIARLQKDNPAGWQQAVAKVVGADAAKRLYGPGAKEQVTVTRQNAVELLHAQPTPEIQQALQSMLVEEAMHQEIVKQGVHVSDAEVSDRLSRMLKDVRKARNVPATMTDDAYLKSLKLDRAKILPQLHKQMEALALVKKDVEQKFGHPIGPDDFLQARNILISVQDGGPTVADADKKKADDAALAKANGIAADIKAGKTTFEKAADDTNQDSTKGKGGDLGVFMRGMMVKEFDAAAFALKPGDVSAPVKSPFGYHLIRVDKVGKDIPADQRQTVMDQYLQNELQNYVNVLMKQKSKVVNKLPQPAPQGMMLPQGPSDNSN